MNEKNLRSEALKRGLVLRKHDCCDDACHMQGRYALADVADAIRSNSRGVRTVYNLWTLDDVASELDVERAA